MLNSVLCYLEKDGHWLMMNRIKKKNDLNIGKWVAPGGKLEEKESEKLLNKVKDTISFSTPIKEDAVLPSVGDSFIYKCKISLYHCKMFVDIFFI